VQVKYGAMMTVINSLDMSIIIVLGTLKTVILRNKDKASIRKCLLEGMISSDSICIVMIRILRWVLALRTTNSSSSSSKIAIQIPTTIEAYTWLGSQFIM
jgi:hypothetical protein